MKVHEQIKALVKNRNLLLKEIGGELNISISEVSRIVNGKLKTIPQKHIKKLEAYFNTKLGNKAPLDNKFILIKKPASDEEGLLLKYYDVISKKETLEEKRKLLKDLNEKIETLLKVAEMKIKYISQTEGELKTGTYEK